ncbi:MAG: S41 family peptidase [Candidatus Eremiobacteraeota bacterium]|nr:S41 family peptidase [Candidatus Eremiobacteraeota bacterium]
MHKYRNIIIVILLILVSSSPACAGKKPISLSRLMYIVHREYVEEIPRVRLATGALKGMQTYLKLRGQNGAFLGINSFKLTEENAGKILDESYNEVLKRYPTIPEEGLSRAGIRGMMAVLSDPYSYYLTPKEYRDLLEDMQTSSFAGIGILIELNRERHNQLTVVEPIENSPAYRAGLKSGDMILEIDGKSTKDITLEEAQALIRGKKGTNVTLTIKRPSTGKIFKVTITRDDITTKAVYYRMIYGVIGYIKVRFFGKNTGKELENAISRLDRKGAEGFILDLRNNGGGYINSALEVVSQILPSGSKVVSVIERNSPVETMVSRPNLNIPYPFVVLINRNSASASEITAASLQEYGRSPLVGERTFGKASVQRIFPLVDNSAVKLTIARYLTPSNKDIEKKGIIPDVPVIDRIPSYKYEFDSVINVASDILRKEIREKRGKYLTLEDILNKISQKYCPECGEKMIILDQKLSLKNGQFYEDIVIGCPSGHYKKRLSIKRVELLQPGNLKRQVNFN